MDSSLDDPRVAPILASLGREICRPLDALRLGLQGILDDPDQPGSEAEQAHARTMIQLCDDLRRLTEASLGSPPPVG